MLMGDASYRLFRAFLEVYAKTIGDAYARPSDLPKKDNFPEQFFSKTELKIVNTPPAWAERLLQVTLYAWDDRKKAWDAEPMAIADRMVFGKGKLWPVLLPKAGPLGHF